jgi:rod shape determining protein RodA
MQLEKNRHLGNLDFGLLGALLGIIMIGTAAVISTTGARFGDFHPFLLKQCVSMLIGSSLAFLLYRWDYHDVHHLSRWLYLLNLASLILVRVVGHSELGAQRWIQVGPLTIQPSEIAKLIGIITLASFLDRQERFDRWIDLVPSVLYMLPAMGLILIQPDLGTSLVFVVIVVAMLYVAGAPGPRLALVTIGGLAIAVTWIVLHLHYPTHIWIPLKEYQLTRLIVFTNPDYDPSGLGYQISEAKLAIGTGGLFGQGLFHGTITQLNYLPEQYTDFIFASLTEELGFVGAGGLLLLFGIFIFRIVRVAGMARDKLGALLATGVGAMFAFHVVENVGMNLGVMPVAGIPLSFVSYGGTAMWVNLAAVGLVLTVWRNRRDIQF